MPEAHTPAAFVPVTPASLSGRGTDFLLSPAAHSCGHAINKLDALLGDLHDVLDARARQGPRPRRCFGAGHGVDKDSFGFLICFQYSIRTKLRSQCGATVRRKRKCDYPTNTAVPCPRRNGERRSPYLVRYRARIDRQDHIRHDSAHRIKRVHQRGVRNSLGAMLACVDRLVAGPCCAHAPLDAPGIAAATSNPRIRFFMVLFS